MSQQLHTWAFIPDKDMSHKTFTQMLKAALFVIPQSWEQSRYTSMEMVKQTVVYILQWYITLQ